MTLAGRVALVTGAGQGNGAAIARGLAARGALAIATDLDGAAADVTARSYGGPSFALDVTDDAACDQLAARVAAEVGPVSILVNNAGILVRAPCTDRDAWRRTLDVNVGGMVNATLAFLPQLRETRGCVVNVASIQSFVAPPGTAAYSASKGAVAQLTRALAVELAPDGVRVNAIAPGIIATAMSAPTRADPERLARFLAHVPMGRVGEPEELAGPVAFLASAEASYVTGAILPVDGGFLTI